MRFIPMSLNEQCDLEQRMLQHFQLLPDEWKDAASVTSTRNLHRTKQFPKRARQALDISQAFFSLAIDEHWMPIDREEMTLAIRYKLGYGWLAWLLFRTFAVPIIRWLWNEWHKPAGQSL